MNGEDEKRLEGLIQNMEAMGKRFDETGFFTSEDEELSNHLTEEARKVQDQEQKATEEIMEAYKMGKMEYIKVNLPTDKESYIQGNGEGVFVLVTEETKRAHDSNEEGTVYKGILDNDSIYFKDLTHGAIIPIEMRGEQRPVCPFNWLKSNFMKSSTEETQEDQSTYKQLLEVFKSLNDEKKESVLKLANYENLSADEKADFDKWLIENEIPPYLTDPFTKKSE